MTGPYERRGDWVDRLAALLRESRDVPFQWGEHDCMQWASKCIAAQADADPLAEVRGSYRSPRGAMRVLKQLGARLPIDLADAWWGPRVHVSRARLGDLVACDLGQPAEMGLSVGVCYGLNSYFVGTRVEDSGLVRVETLTLEHCYQPWASSSRP